MKRRKTGGRKKGSLNKTTREIKASTSAFLSSPAYVAAAKKRILNGEAPHLETLWHHYAFGKPKETVALEGKPTPMYLLPVIPSMSPDLE